MSKLDPNPHSPYADADPNYRHVFPNPIFFPTPQPGVLALAACELLAVVPEEPLQDAMAGDGVLPEGLCPECVSVMQGGRPPKRPSSQCGECESATWHGELCALCRQEKHEAWWPTRDQQQVEEQPTTEACGKCQTVFDPTDTRFDGHARFYLTPYCRRCVDQCHDTEIADHRCVICA